MTIMIAKKGTGGIPMGNIFGYTSAAHKGVFNTSVFNSELDAICEDHDEKVIEFKAILIRAMRLLRTKYYNNVPVAKGQPNTQQFEGEFPLKIDGLPHELSIIMIRQASWVSGKLVVSPQTENERLLHMRAELYRGREPKPIAKLRIYDHLSKEQKANYMECCELGFQPFKSSTLTGEVAEFVEDYML